MTMASGKLECEIQSNFKLEQAAVYQAQSNRLVLAVTLPIVGAILAFALFAYLYWLRRHKSGYNLPQPASPEPFYTGYSRR